MKTKFKSLSVILASAFFIYGCGSAYNVSRVGELNMVSTKNIDNSANYEELKTYAGVSGQDLESAMSKGAGIIKKKSALAGQIEELKGSSINDGIDKVVRNVPGGTYMTNVVVYRISEKSPGGSGMAGKVGGNKDVKEEDPQEFYIVSGDVWGVRKANANIRGFSKGDSVTIIETSSLKSSGVKVAKNEQVPGQIVELKGVKAMVKLGSEYGNKIVEVPYSAMTKN